MQMQKRRIKQKLNTEQIIDVLNRNTSGVLSLIDENGNPYGVPLNYSYMGGKLIFHTSRIGYKLDLIKKNNNCSFTVIDQDEVVEEEYTSLYRSVILQGNINIVSDRDEMVKYMNMFTDKYVPMKEERPEIIRRNLPALCILILDIKEMSGKCALGLVSK